MARDPLPSIAPSPSASLDQHVAPLARDIVKIETRNLNFHYGATRALFDVNFAAARNQVTAIIGPSGCGKSTLLRTLNGIFRLYPGQRADGELLLDGRNMLAPDTNLNLWRARVGMVFQRPTPFPMSIFDNVAFGITVFEHLPREAMAERVERALHRAALWDEVKDRLFASALGLSGGQQQRLCVARGLASEPEVLLLDEPSSALDPISSHKLEQTIVELKSDVTIIIVTHNLQQAMRVADYTGFMYQGRLVEFGDSGDLFERPRVQRTADYVTGRFG